MVNRFINIIKNAQKARKEYVKFPYSNFDFSVAEILAKKGFIEAVAKKGRLPKRIIEVKMKYDETGRGAIEGVRFWSKPARRMYTGYKSIKPVRQGYGAAIVSTSKGVMAADEARKQKVGGEILFEIW